MTQQQRHFHLDLREPHDALRVAEALRQANIEIVGGPGGLPQPRRRNPHPSTGQGDLAARDGTDTVRGSLPERARRAPST